MKKPLLLAVSILLSSCSTTDYSSVQKVENHKTQTHSNSFINQANHLLNQAKGLSLVDSRKKQLEAVNTLLDGKLLSEAQKLLHLIDTTTLGVELSSEKSILTAKLKLMQQEPEEALKILRNVWVPSQLPEKLQAALYETRAKSYLRLGNGLEAVRAYSFLAEALPEVEREEIHQTIWETLNQIPVNALNLSGPFSNNNKFNGWVDLNKITRKNDSHPQELIEDLKEWQASYKNHPGKNILPGFQSISLEAPMFPEKIAVLLPLTGKYASSAKTIQNGILSAYYDEKNTSASPHITFIDTNEGKEAKEAYKKALRFGADFIIGPLTKEGVAQLTEIRNLLSPVLALNQINTKAKNEKLFQFGLLPEDEALSVTEKAQADGFKNAVILVPDSDWGERIASTFIDSWQEKEGRILDIYKFKDKKDIANLIKKSLHINESETRARRLSNTLGEALNNTPRRRQDIDFIFLVSSPKDARQIKPLLNFYYAADIPVYSTSSVYGGTPSKYDQDLETITFCDIPWILDKSGKVFFKRKHSEQLITIKDATSKRLFAFGIDAYKLSSQINYLSAFPMLGTNGMTGRLKLQQDRTILRQLTWAKIKNGSPELILN